MKKVLGGLVLAMPAFAFAAPVDVAAVVTDIGAQAVPIGLVGAAVLIIIYAAKAFGWIKRAG